MTTSQPLATVAAEDTWINPDLLAVTAEVVDRRQVSGDQTRSEVEGEYVVFENTLTIPGGETVATSYVLDTGDPAADRVGTVAEALAELTHAAAFGDTEADTLLSRLLGAEDTQTLKAAGVEYL
jgi:hypothetical protein